MAAHRYKFCVTILLLSSALLFITLLFVTLSDHLTSKDADKELYMRRATQYLASEDFKNAEREYLKVLRLFPGDAVAARELGVIYFDQGRLSKSYEYLQQAAALEPENDTVKLKLGAVYLAVGVKQKAKRAANSVLTRDPVNEEAVLLLTDAARSTQDIQDARQRIEALRQQVGDRAVYEVALGTLDLRQLDTAGAEADLIQALQLDPSFAPAQFALGHLYWMRNDAKRADHFLAMATQHARLRSNWRIGYADFKRANGERETADLLLKEITQKAPDFLPAWVDLMNLACREGRVQDCVKIADTILAEEPTNYAALVAKANLKLPLESLQEFARLRSMYDRVPDLHYQIALKQLSIRNVDQAIDSLDRAVALDPDFEDAVVLRDELKLIKGDAATAIASLTELIKREPPRIGPHLILADAYLIQHNSGEALATYRRMSDLFPKDPQPALLIGMYLARQNRPADARSAFEEALRIAPGYLPALSQIVKMDIAENHREAAASRVEEQLAKSPTVPSLWCLKAEIDLAREDYDAAEAASIKAIELDANFEPAYLLLGAAYVATHRLQEALEQLTSFANRNKSPAVLLQIAMIQTDLKDFEAARSTYEQLLTVEPDSAAALNNLASIYTEKIPDLAKAAHLAEKAWKMMPNDPYICDTLGWIYIKRAYYYRGLSLLEQSAHKLPDRPEIQFHLATALYSTQQISAAITVLQRAKESNQEFPDREKALQLLDELTTQAEQVETHW
ncbi:tetratricopeptide repeat protein [Methylovirgula sp. 4M-Z18]|uniref:tetratricopeptide repeat protein n=1 Tax=Methylovirgula sp. 4M-Z18 TaxID=2293567 RepID=UPI0011C078BD|nr:tetratricopeptide repeat protein [Methylovirgula sp. 4M-Z18]